MSRAEPVIGALAMLLGIMGAGTRGPRPRVLEVPGQYATVQSAIDRAADGDTVLVAPGRYVENVDFRGRAIVLASRYVRTHDVTDIRRTILDGSRPRDADSASVVRITSPVNGRAALIGFTITGGHGTRWTDVRNGHVYVEGGGVFCELASPLIAYNIIVDNDAVARPATRGAGGGGIRCGDGEPEIAHNVIVHNHGPYGAGLVLYFAAAHVHDNLIAWNTGGDSFGGAGFWIAGRLASTAPAVLRRNVVAHNRAERPGRAVPGLPPEAGTGGAILVYSGGVYENRVIGCGNVLASNTQVGGPAVVSRRGDVASGLWAAPTTPPDTAAAGYLAWTPPDSSSRDGAGCAPRPASD